VATGLGSISLGSGDRWIGRPVEGAAEDVGYAHVGSVPAANQDEFLQDTIIHSVLETMCIE
jgi:hypothetical protein